MSDTHYSDTPEELRALGPSLLDVPQDSMSTTETLSFVDATPTEASLPGYTDKDSMNSPMLDRSESRQRGVTVKDPLYSVKPGKFPFSYQVPERIRSLDDYQRGYSRLAAFQDCDPNFSVYRKHGWLHNRVLLHLQAELQELEHEIQMVEEMQAERGLLKGLRCDHIDKPRTKELLAEAKVKLADYDDLLLRLQKKHAIKRPTRAMQYSVMKFAFASLVDMDTHWICLTDDLVALADDSDQSWLFTMIIFWAARLVPNLTAKIFRTRAQRIITGTVPALHLYSPARLEAFARSLLTISATAIALAPLYALDLLSRDRALTVYASTLGFSAFCAVFVKASKDQVFAATSGYLALQVLAMILGSEKK